MFICSEHSLCLGQSAGVPDGDFDVSHPLVPVPARLHGSEVPVRVA